MSESLVKPSETATALAKPDVLPEWLAQTQQTSFSTIDLTTEAGKSLLSKVSIGADEQLSAMINTELDIVSWYCAPYDRTDEKTGEVVSLVYIALICADGKTYGCSSIGVRRSLLLLSQMHGFRAWNPPVRVKVRAVKASIGRMFALEYVSRPQPEHPKLKGK